MTRLLAGAVALLFCCAIIPNGARAACPGTYVELGGKCYYFFNNDPQTFLGARQVCQNLIGGDLAVLEDCNDHRLIADHIKNNPSEEVPEGYWIGGSDIIQDGQFLWIEGESVPMGAPFWGRSADSPGEPSGGDSANCAFMATGEGFYFHDNDCEEPEGLAPLCQIDTVAVCPEYYDAIAGSCFQFLPLLEETWEDARYICQASAGDLAIVDDCNVMSSIINFIQNLDEPLPIKGYWIGATDAVSEGNWLWVNNATVAMGVPFWGSEGSGPLQPDDQFATQNCLELWARDRYYFNDVECSPTEGRAPLCETNPI